MSEAKIILTDVFVEKYDNLKKQNKQYTSTIRVCALIYYVRATVRPTRSLACFCCRCRLLAHSLLLFKLIIYLRTKNSLITLYIHTILFFHFPD